MEIINKDCLVAMREMQSESVDSIVTDPPYELGFMGKSWDSTGIAFSVDVWREALRVLKPGGHLIAFSGSRTYHRMAVAIEDAGFEIRDQIQWIYGSGFPKSLNIGKQLDEWQGWGTALKPAHEPIILARKPVKKTIVKNVSAYGTGGLNIDKSRVPSTDNFDALVGRPIQKLATRLVDETDEDYRARVSESPAQQEALAKLKELGRWPANVIHDGSYEVVDLLGEPARFFYCAKASKRDRNEGLDLEDFPLKHYTTANKMGGEADTMLTGSGNPRDSRKQNHHPTVKPTTLMQYLVRLVTPPNGIVLDPFMGSGSTGKACAYESFDFIGIDTDSEYCKIAKNRIEFAHQAKTETLSGGSEWR